MTEAQRRARTAWIVWILIAIAVGVMVTTLMRPGPPNAESSSAAIDAAARPR